MENGRAAKGRRKGCKMRMYLGVCRTIQNKTERGGQLTVKKNTTRWMELDLA